MAYELQSTIVAVATPAGRSAIGLLRLSGSSAVKIACQLCPDLEGAVRFQQATVCNLEIPLESGRHLKEKCVVTCWAEPQSYTGEDVAEISTHGNPILISRITDQCLALGARPAEAGEFTFRAYLNGKLDLVQAEAVQELIQAGSIKALQLAESAVTGLPSLQLRGWEDRLTRLLAAIEVTHDYAADDLDATLDPALLVNNESAAIAIGDLLVEISASLEVSKRVAPLKSGISVAICGPTNAGKSTLFNKLLGHERALTSQQPGTTRDYLSESLQFGGINLTLVDTAGYRKAGEALELAGISKAGDWARTADLVMWVVSALDDDRHIPDDIQLEQSITVVTQCDRLDRWPNPVPGLIHVSGLTGEGLDQLLARIEESLPDLDSSATASYSNRQSAALMDCLRNLEAAFETANRGLPLDAVAVDLYSARRAVHGVYRHEDSEAVIQAIFSGFCVGK